MFEMKLKGDFKKTDKYLKKKLKIGYWELLEHYGQQGVDALKMLTPVDTGKTAASWYYEIEATEEGVELRWCNSNINKYVNIAILIQSGHATRGGTYVKGIDYINPALQPVFEDIANILMKEVAEE